MSKEADPLRAEPQNAPRIISPAAQRALDEAAARRSARAATIAHLEHANLEHANLEHDGPKGVEPTRFGDWERKGIAYDF